MENVAELMKHIEDNLLKLNFNKNTIAFKIKDFCLTHYKYAPTFNKVHVVVHTWVHPWDDAKIIYLDTVRKFLIDDLFELMCKLQLKYVHEAQQFEQSDEETYEKFRMKIKKIDEICVALQNGDIFRAFVNEYSNGYLN